MKNLHNRYLQGTTFQENTAQSSCANHHAPRWS